MLILFVHKFKYIGIYVYFNLESCLQLHKKKHNNNNCEQT